MTCGYYVYHRVAHRVRWVWAEHVNHHSASTTISPRRCGIVQSIGDRFLTRIVTPRDVLAPAREGNAVSLRMNDFTWKGGRFVFAYEADAGVTAALQGHDQTRKAA